MPSILLVTHLFPPDYGVGAKRALRMANHLTDLGWEVRVLTVRESYAEHWDLSLVSAPRRYRVIRTHAIDPRAWLRHLRRLHLAFPTGAERDGESFPREGRWSRAARALGSLYDACFAIPDAQGGWMAIAVPVGLLCGRHVDLVLATSPPKTSSLVAALLSRILGIPLVLDFRDPWFPLPDEDPRPSWIRPLDRALERFCVRQASAVIATTRWLADELRARGAAQASWIPNAFEPAVLAGITPVRDARFTIAYTGTFYGSRSVEPFLRALASLRASGRMPASGLVLRVLGVSGEDVVSLARRYGVEPWVEVRGFLPYREALAQIMGADVLFLVVGDVHGGLVPAKLFDYLAARRFILAVAPPGSEAGAMIRELGVGTTVPSADIEGIARALAARFDAPRELGESAGVSQFKARATMEHLDRFLRTVLEATGRPGAGHPAPGPDSRAAS